MPFPWIYSNRLNTWQPIHTIVLMSQPSCIGNDDGGGVGILYSGGRIRPSMARAHERFPGRHTLGSIVRPSGKFLQRALAATG
jgi:hypothetical protein